VTRGRLPQRAGSPSLNRGGTAAMVPPHMWDYALQCQSRHTLLISL